MPEFNATHDPVFVGREMATINTWAHDGSGGYTKGALQVAPDRLPTLKAGWIAAQEEFLSIKRDSHWLRSVGAPGNDEVSKQAVKNLGRMAGDEEGFLGKTLDDCVAYCQHVIDEVDKTMKMYKVADTSAEIKFKM
ncbi:hypothetical protein [Kutzneria albida]|uniref:Uncharacterized protein n=1 Tax=Kutzneria albida DSM 43870 TaxID=1449976 RepID=W5W158_9PSEU|nr:hypothetical protein [Kutzneria albida]AHH94530.1 hypothetical protein KALB_1157 [Kutzneria albida DSM 43870]